MPAMLKKVEKGSTKTEAGAICIAPQLGWRRWIFPKHTAVQAGETLGRNRAYQVTMREEGQSEYESDSDFFTQPDAQRFEIEDTDLRKKFIDNLEKTRVAFKVTKVALAIPRDFFKSEESREEAVAEAVAKYYYNSHHNPAITSKMFCSQFVVQSLQNALVEKSCEEKNKSLGNPIAESFEEWKKNHINDIREAVKEFPPQLKHASSAITPTGLASILNELTKARSQESVAEKKEEVVAPRASPTPSPDKPNTSCKPSFAIQLLEKFQEIFRG